MWILWFIAVSSFWSRWPSHSCQIWVRPRPVWHPWPSCRDIFHRPHSWHNNRYWLLHSSPIGIIFLVNGLICCCYDDCNQLSVKEFFVPGLAAAFKPPADPSGNGSDSPGLNLRTSLLNRLVNGHRWLMMVVAMVTMLVMFTSSMKDCSPGVRTPTPTRSQRRRSENVAENALAVREKTTVETVRLAGMRRVTRSARTDAAIAWPRKR